MTQYEKEFYALYKDKRPAHGIWLPTNYQGREQLRMRFGFAIPDTQAIECLRKFAPWVEVGAGTGYWTHELTQAGVSCIATDAEPLLQNTYGFVNSWCNVQVLDGLEAVQKYPDRNLLMVWPCYNKPWATRVLKRFTGPTFALVSEGHGGCVADDSLFEELRENWHSVEQVDIPQWPSIHDYLEVFQRGKRED